MNLTEKLESLKAEKAQKEAEKDAAHQRIITLNKLIKATENLIKEAEDVFLNEPKIPPGLVGAKIPPNEISKAFEGDNGSMVGKSY